jgi:predicted flap endonuclease-1-like 5' DNA nuclease
MSSNGSADRSKIWGWAAVAGVLAFLALKFIAQYNFGPALLLAILIGVLVAILLWIGFYRDAPSEDMGPGSMAASSGSDSTGSATVKPAQTAKPDEDMTPSLAADPTAKPKTAAKSTSSKAKTTTKAAKPKAKTTPKKAADEAAKTTASSLMGEAGAAMVNEKKAEKAKPARKPVAKNGKPPVIRKARAGGADDLKVITGVGAGLEKTLNDLGFYHYDQIASWRKREIEWVDERLKFKGRIERDGWIKQAKSLAKKA